MLGSRIKALMKAQGLTQAQLAAKAGISQSSISTLINETSAPKSSTLEAVAEVLGTTSAELQEESVESAVVEKCPRCGSRFLAMWQNLGTGACRYRCDYCELDTGEQSTAEKAKHVLLSYSPTEVVAEHAAVRVFPLAELLSSSCFDSEAVRPVWFENRGLFVCPALLQYGIAEREQELVRVLWSGAFGYKSFELSKYNGWWRVWSDKPTEAQSDAWSWDDAVR